MIWIFVTLEKVLSSPSCANPVAYPSIQTDGHLWHILNGTHCTGTDCCLLAWFLQSSNNSAGPSWRFYLFHLSKWLQAFFMLGERKKFLTMLIFLPLKLVMLLTSWCSYKMITTPFVVYKSFWFCFDKW